MNELREKVFKKVKKKLDRLKAKPTIEEAEIEELPIEEELSIRSSSTNELLEELSDEDEELYETIDRIADYIMEFCNRSDIPQGLFHTWVDMAFNYHKSILASFTETVQTSESSDGVVETDEGGDIKSFSVDGVSMTFVTSLELEAHKLKMQQAQANAETLLASYKDILYKYRKIRR